MKSILICTVNINSLGNIEFQLGFYSEIFLKLEAEEIAIKQLFIFTDNSVSYRPNMQMDWVDELPLHCPRRK